MILLLIPPARKNEKVLGWSCVAVFIGTWIDKGLGLVAGGFIPSSLHHVQEYTPTIPEIIISMGVYGIGILCLTVLLKMAVTVKLEVR
jgi:[DsrC]-trisulfide reductase subunit P